MIGCSCSVCRSTDPRDKRLRTAILVRHQETVFAVDTPPDFRTQCLREHIERLDAVVYTHSHTDHTSGFDDLRRFCEINGGTMPIHASAQVMKDLQTRFPFAFDAGPIPVNYLNPVPRIFDGPFSIGRVEITPVALPHGRFNTSGFVFSVNGRRIAAYFTDCNAVPEAAVEAARGVEVVVLDTLRWRPHPTHLSVEEALEAAGRINAPLTLLTHLSHDLGHEETEAKLPQNVRLASDGLRLVL
jgi:phosphoribosyl 1,2-cyclic phosphate phosphodiesterase